MSSIIFYWKFGRIINGLHFGVGVNYGRFVVNLARILGHVFRWEIIILNSWDMEQSQLSIFKTKVTAEVAKNQFRWNAPAKQIMFSASIPFVTKNIWIRIVNSSKICPSKNWIFYDSPLFFVWVIGILWIIFFYDRLSRFITKLLNLFAHQNFFSFARMEMIWYVLPKSRVTNVIKKVLRRCLWCF